MQNKQYNPGGTSLMEMMEIVESYFPNKSNNVLDIGGNKSPHAARKLAKWFPDSQFTHFREDNIRVDKISPLTQGIPNLEVISSYRKLNGPYDITLAFFTLHELKKPKKGLEKALRKMDSGGKVICVEYDLNWFSDLSKQNNWNLSNQRSNFSKYVFTEGNENVVMGMSNGVVLPKDKINENLVEESCVYEHTKLGRDKYLRLFSKSGLKTLDLISFNIQIPLDEKHERPKCFCYIGEKI